MTAPERHHGGALDRVRNQSGYDIGWSAHCLTDGCHWTSDLHDRPGEATASLAQHLRDHAPRPKD